MQPITETVEYFKTVSKMISGSTLAFEKMPEPFCMWSWIMKDDCPVDLTLMGFNPAFKKMVNNQAVIGVHLSTITNSDVLTYWIEKFWPLSNEAREVRVSDYISTGHKIKFDLVVAYPAELLGQRGIAMVFFDKAPTSLHSSKIAHQFSIEVNKNQEDGYRKELAFAKLFECELEKSHTIAEGLAKLRAYIDFFETLLPEHSLTSQEGDQPSSRNQST